MEKFMVGTQFEDDFIVKSLETVELPDTDEMYDKERPYVTHGVAQRADGATVTFAFQHNGKKPVMSNQVAGIPLEFNELRLGFYLRKQVEANESRIIRVGASGSA